MISAPNFPTFLTVLGFDGAKPLADSCIIYFARTITLKFLKRKYFLNQRVCVGFNVVFFVVCLGHDFRVKQRQTLNSPETLVLYVKSA